jgi:hypothetical protein
MSIIGGVGGALFQFLSGLSNSQSVSTPQSATSTDTSGSSASQAIAGAGHHGHGHHGGLFQKIAASVTSALQSAQAGGSSKIDKTIQDAIAKILTQAKPSTNGVTASGTQATPSADPDSDGDIDTPGQSDSDVGSAISSFLQTLQNAGVSPQQFRQDFLAALQNVNGGQSDPTGSAQLLPPGSLLNTLA